MIHDAIFERLSSFTTLTALVGTRIYPVVLPQDCAMPALAFARISDPAEIAVDGSVVMHRSRFQFSCYAKTPKEARAVAERVIEALSGYRDATIKGTLYDNAQDLYEPDNRLYHVPVDFFVSY